MVLQDKVILDDAVLDTLKPEDIVVTERKLIIDKILNNPVKPKMLIYCNRSALQSVCKQYRPTGWSYNKIFIE